MKVELRVNGAPTRVTLRAKPGGGTNVGQGCRGIRVPYQRTDRRLAPVRLVLGVPRSRFVLRVNQISS